VARTQIDTENKYNGKNREWIMIQQVGIRFKERWAYKSQNTIKNARKNPCDRCMRIHDSRLRPLPEHTGTQQTADGAKEGVEEDIEEEESHRPANACSRIEHIAI